MIYGEKELMILFSYKMDDATILKIILIYDLPNIIY